MHNDTERDWIQFLNERWNNFPRRLQQFILNLRLAIVIIGGIGTLFVAVNFILKFLDSDTADRKPENETSIEFIANKIYVETMTNVRTLEELQTRDEKSSLKQVNPSFARSACNKYEGGIPNQELSKQIINFCTNLEAIEIGVRYTSQMISETIGQGSDILNKLEQEYGFRNYFKGVPGVHAASADAAVPAGFGNREHKKPVEDAEVITGWIDMLERTQ